MKNNLVPHTQKICTISSRDEGREGRGEEGYRGKEPSRPVRPLFLVSNRVGAVHGSIKWTCNALGWFNNLKWVKTLMVDTAYFGFGSSLAQQPWPHSFLAGVTGFAFFCWLGLGSYSGNFFVFLKRLLQPEVFAAPFLKNIPLASSSSNVNFPELRIDSKNICRILWVSFSFSNRSPASALETQSQAGRTQMLVNASSVDSQGSFPPKSHRSIIAARTNYKTPWDILLLSEWV